MKMVMVKMNQIREIRAVDVNGVWAELKVANTRNVENIFRLKA